MWDQGNYLYYTEECLLEMPMKIKLTSLSHTQGVSYVNELPLGPYTATFLTNTCFLTLQMRTVTEIMLFRREKPEQAREDAQPLTCLCHWRP